MLNENKEITYNTAWERIYGGNSGGVSSDGSLPLQFMQRIWMRICIKIQGSLWHSFKQYIFIHSQLSTR